MKTIGTIFLILVIAVIGLGIYSQFNEDEPSGMTPSGFSPKGLKTEAVSTAEDKDAELRRLITARIEASLSKTSTKNQEVVRKAGDDIASAVQRNMDLARQNIPSVLSVLTNFKGCAKLVWLMAKDKVNSTAETEQHIQTTLDQYILVHALKGTKDAENILARVNDELAKNSTDMTVEIAAAVQGLTNSVEPALKAKYEDFIKTLNESGGSLKTISLETMGFSVGMILEGIFLKSTISQARRVLGTIAARMGTTVAASLFSAAADGPLPVGDIVALVIAVGGAAWSAYDLYKAQFVLKNELEASLMSSTSDYEKQAIAESTTAARKLAEGYGEANQTTARTVLAKLN